MSTTHLVGHILECVVSHGHDRAQLEDGTEWVLDRVVHAVAQVGLLRRLPYISSVTKVERERGHAALRSTKKGRNGISLRTGFLGFSL